MPDEDGRPVTSPMGTAALWNIYPAAVKRWISKHGGLSRKMIYMQGRDMQGIVSGCGEPTRQVNVRSERRYAARPIRYGGANAASDRR